MVVLSVGLETSPEAIDLAEKLGVPLDNNQFAKVSSFSPVTTETPGIYACGAFDGPKDIPRRSWRPRRRPVRPPNPWPRPGVS